MHFPLHSGQSDRRKPVSVVACNLLSMLMNYIHNYATYCLEKL